MGQDVFTYGNFTVTKSNPSGNIVRFTVTDTQNLLTTSKILRAVLTDAIQQWIDAERADLDTNGDTAVKGAEELAGVGDGFSQFDFVFGSKVRASDFDRAHQHFDKWHNHGIEAVRRRFLKRSME